MINDIDYLRFGSEKQKRAYNAIYDLGIMNDLSDYTPVLCGTIPIEVDIECSDLDIIMEVNNFKKFETRINALYNGKKDFLLKSTIIRNIPIIKANFIFEGFEFELFGQAQPVQQQYAYLHMIIEQTLLKQFPTLKEEVIRLKQQGFKTEPAFCNILGLKGDPYERLIEFGKEKGIIV